MPMHFSNGNSMCKVAIQSAIQCAKGQCNLQFKLEKHLSNDNAIRNSVCIIFTKMLMNTHIDKVFSTLYSNGNAFVKWQFNVQMTMQSAIQFVLF